MVSLGLYIILYKKLCRITVDFASMYATIPKVSLKLTAVHFPHLHSPPPPSQSFLSLSLPSLPGNLLRRVHLMRLISGKGAKWFASQMDTAHNSVKKKFGCAFIGLVIRLTCIWTAFCCCFGHVSISACALAG